MIEILHDCIYQSDQNPRNYDSIDSIVSLVKSRSCRISIINRIESSGGKQEGPPSIEVDRLLKNRWR